MNTDSNTQSQSPYFYAFTLVFLAGLLWSFGVVTVRYMVDGHDYVFQYLFYRGISIAIILIVYLFIREGLLFYKNFLKIGVSGVLGGLFLATAFTGFIFSITMTTAAVTLFMLAAMPFHCSYCWLFCFRRSAASINSYLHGYSFYWCMHYDH